MSKQRTSAIWQVSKEAFQAIVNRNTTYTGVLREFGLDPIGGNWNTLKKRLLEEGVSISHFHQKGNGILHRDFQELLVDGSSYNKVLLKRRLLDAGLLKNVCALCGQLPEWKGSPLVLIMDHINGIHTDDRLENLRILCPHCNSQTTTFCGRNRRKTQRTHRCICGNALSGQAHQCDVCSQKLSPGARKTKIQWPSLESLVKVLQEKPIFQLGKDLGVSDQAIRKHLGLRGYSYIPRKGVVKKP